MYNQLNVLFQHCSTLVRLFYVQDQRYLVDFDEQEEAEKENSTTKVN